MDVNGLNGSVGLKWEVILDEMFVADKKQLLAQNPAENRSPRRLFPFEYNKVMSISLRESYKLLAIESKRWDQC